MSFTLKRGDLLPILKVKAIAPGVGGPLDLTGATAKFKMRTSAGASVIDATATITDAVNGKMEYAWVSGDTATIGSYRAEFEITYPGPVVLTLPNNSYLPIEIISDLDVNPGAVVAAETGYISRAELLEIISQDSMARLGTDATRKWTVGTGDGVTTYFTTPFVEVATFKGYVNNVLVTPAPTISAGTGPSGEDVAIFSTPPAYGAAVAVSADPTAISLTLVQQGIDLGSSVLDGYLARYTPPITNAKALETIKAHLGPIIKFRMRARRDLPISDGLMQLYKDAIAYFTLIMKGQDLPGITADTTGLTGLPASGALITAEDPVFGPPFTENVTITY